MPTVTMIVNVQPASAAVEANTLLVECLREHLGLAGTHMGCDTSQCGACVVHVDGVSANSCTMLAVTGAGPTALRHRDLERHLDGDFSAAALDRVTVTTNDLLTDAHGSADYRAHLIPVLARRALAPIAGT